MIKIPVDVGIIYEGERIRGPDTQVEFGGPKVKYKAELTQVKPEKEIEDGKVEVVGKDIGDFEEGSKQPLGIYLEVYGKEIDSDLEPVIERRNHDFMNYIQGVMHLNQRYDIWIRVSKEAKKKGLTFKHIGGALMDLFKKELPFIQKMQITFITDEKKVEEFYNKALKVYESRDVRVRGMKDKDVEDFYACTLCQSFAPNHICMISPQRTSLCGAISWIDASAAARVEPDGPIYKVVKGETIDEEKGEYSGVNDAVKEGSNGANERFQMYSMFDKPHTSCGCFEAIAFYIPEVDGIGVLDRNFKGETVNGLKFSTMASQSGGGIQTEGFLGFGLQWMHSDKFLSADGGWNRIAWMPSNVKERMADAIPKELFEKIPTENEVKGMEELKTFLKEKKHPLMSRQKEDIEEAPKEKAGETLDFPQGQEVISAPTLALPAAGGFRIILKNAKIHAEKVIIKKVDKKR
ncbi:MAG: CO dehydrogenase/CO-methylating acetyl-CoA synthase complex subunit beta [Candidatus Altiarchaeota archaeon]